MFDEHEFRSLSVPELEERLTTVDLALGWAQDPTVVRRMANPSRFFRVMHKCRRRILRELRRKLYEL